jgi:hypothetical protein
VDVVPVPHDCKDGFLCAYWRRPAMYLDPLVRNGISTLSKIPNIQSGLKKLERDLASGKWEEKFGDIFSEDNFDYGYRLISCGVRAA